MRKCEHIAVRATPSIIVVLTRVSREYSARLLDFRLQLG